MHTNGPYTKRNQQKPDKKKEVRTKISNRSLWWGYWGIVILQGAHKSVTLVFFGSFALQVTAQYMVTFIPMIFFFF